MINPKNISNIKYLNLVLLLAWVGVSLVSCEFAKPPAAGSPAPTPTPNKTNQALAGMTGSVAGREWSPLAADAFPFLSTFNEKLVKIRLSDTQSTQACVKDAQSTVYKDRRVYIQVPRKVGTWNVASFSGSVYFAYYLDNQPYSDTAEQGFVKITNVTDKLVEGTVEALGHSQHIAGDFSVTLCP